MKKSKNTINLHIYPHTFDHQSRILKETKSLADARISDEVFLVGILEKGWVEEEQIDERRQIWRVRLKIGSRESSLLVKIARYMEWQAKIFMMFRSSRVRVVNCHSLPALPIGAILKYFCNAKLIYDTHEVESKTDSASGVKSILYKTVEKCLIRSVDAVITVSEFISQWYAKAYGLKNIYTVLNIPYRNDDDLCSDSYLKRKLGIGKNDMLFIFQGCFVPGRGIEILLDIFTKMDASKHVVFMGFGELASIIQQHAQTHSNIHFQEAVSPQDVVRFTSGADIGLCLQENISLNHFLTIPNKFFEYIVSGIPVIASDFPGMRRIIEESGCGWNAPVSRDEWFSLINRLTPQNVLPKKIQAIKYRKTIGWQEEEKKMLIAYRDLGLLKSI